jgi:phosphoribosyl 1,2-cyclic phosphodiesterase
LKVTFHGVRGSTPCSCEQNRRYGGNTSCVSLVVDGEDPIVLDLGTGLRFFGDTQPQDGSFRGTALVSHLHWDHVQGLPFFVPILRPGASMRICGPRQDDGRSMADAFDKFMCPPYFPVTAMDLPSELTFESVEEGWFDAGKARVLARSIPHVGRTFGYRVEWDGVAVAYLPDHQQPYDGSFDIADGARELCDGVDLLIHDAQYTVPEFEGIKRTWGHCTMEYALAVAMKCKVGRLAMFHHDPTRDDDTLDEVGRCSRAFADRNQFELLVAAEGGSLDL